MPSSGSPEHTTQPKLNPNGRDPQPSGRLLEVDYPVDSAGSEDFNAFRS